MDVMGIKEGERGEVVGNEVDIHSSRFMVDYGKHAWGREWFSVDV